MATRNLKGRRPRRWLALPALALLAPTLSACAMPGTTDSSAAPAATVAPAAAPTRPPVQRGGGVAAPLPGPSAALRTVTGSWVYKAPGQVETLRLRQHADGSVGGDGDAISHGNNGAVGKFSISVHSGRLRNGALTLELYTQQEFGYYLTAVQDLRCRAEASVLHCLMDLPITANVRNFPQDFYRH